MTLRNMNLGLSATLSLTAMYYGITWVIDGLNKIEYVCSAGPLKEASSQLLKFGNLRKTQAEVDKEADAISKKNLAASTDALIRGGLAFVGGGAIAGRLACGKGINTETMIIGATILDALKPKP